jgi:hypothetical protein
MLVDPSTLPKESDPSLRLIWVDRMELLSRGDAPIGMLRFYSAIGNEKLTEAARLQTTHAHLRGIVDVLCRTLDYYPAKSKP